MGMYFGSTAARESDAALAGLEVVHELPAECGIMLPRSPVAEKLSPLPPMEIAGVEMQVLSRV
jgi:hypothetical protein